MSDKTDSALYIEMSLCDMSLNCLINDMKCNENIYFNNCLTDMGFYLSCEIFDQMLKGVHFLHSQNPPIIHRDLNPYNILIKLQTHIKNIVKIADFGLSTIHRRLDQEHSSDVGNIKYAAPEVLDSNTYDTRADIYSLGMICKELFSIDINRSVLKPKVIHI
jgi:serine/threonine protein kinase